MTILDDILAHKRIEVAAQKRLRPEAALKSIAREREMAPSFSGSLLAVPMGLIAEVKRRSPSAGVIREPFDPESIARAYASAGAQAVSVLMDERYFGGGESDFTQVRQAVSLPLLFKEFVIDPWQVWQAAALGASAVLLIVSALSPDTLRALAATCRKAGLEPLVEVHDEVELEAAMGIESALIGVNNRNLRTFETDIETTIRLAPHLPLDRVLVSESGIRTSVDLARLQAAGARAALVGETLLRSPDPADALRRLRGA